MKSKTSQQEINLLGKLLANEPEFQQLIECRNSIQLRVHYVARRSNLSMSNNCLQNPDRILVCLQLSFLILIFSCTKIKLEVSSLIRNLELIMGRNNKIIQQLVMILENKKVAYSQSQSNVMSYITSFEEILNQLKLRKKHLRCNISLKGKKKSIVARPYLVVPKKNLELKMSYQELVGKLDYDAKNVLTNEAKQVDLISRYFSNKLTRPQQNLLVKKSSQGQEDLLYLLKVWNNLRTQIQQNSLGLKDECLKVISCCYTDRQLYLSPSFIKYVTFITSNCRLFKDQKVYVLQ
ncbi:UNKNOWN [Stylonychia lemnae]|uniref:Uncharacterized protein n=1 Tax=Stylonychia lemnae TaxID=5949 RepID=A0A077ZYE8_STYLE|nr:UNKNOWN [Stylonychia lemnae]|eukprot:CDW74647.1 UNKNOWN [Stylonychia lemnae]